MKVSRLRLLGDNIHSTRIAFVEFVMVRLNFIPYSDSAPLHILNNSLSLLQAESAIMALDCCGQPLGSQPIRLASQTVNLYVECIVFI